MTYLVILKEGQGTPFLTPWYSYENDWNPEKIYMIVHLHFWQYTINGVEWLPLEEDHL